MRWSCLLLPALLHAHPAIAAEAGAAGAESAAPAASTEKPRLGPPGTVELRPVAGANNGLYGPLGTNQLLLGLDVSHAVTSQRSWVFGGWFATGEKLLAVAAHADARYRFTGLNPYVLPFVSGGFGTTVGFPDGKDTIFGLGVRAGGGLDILATSRLIPTLQAVFEVGPRLRPDFGVLVTAQVLLGLAFVL